MNGRNERGGKNGRNDRSGKNGRDGREGIYLKNDDEIVRYLAEQPGHKENGRYAKAGRKPPLEKIVLVDVAKHKAEGGRVQEQPADTHRFPHVVGVVQRQDLEMVRSNNETWDGVGAAIGSRIRSSIRCGHHDAGLRDLIIAAHIDGSIFGLEVKLLVLFIF